MIPKLSKFDRAVIVRHSSPLGYVLMLSFFVNVLMLSGSIYMLQVYDRVLTSRSGATLLFLSLIILVLYLGMYFFDVYRQQLLAVIGRDLEEQLSRPLFEIAMNSPGGANQPDRNTWGIRDLEEVGRFMSGAGLIALFDLPFMPIFVGVCLLFHPLIGGVVLLAMAVLAGLTVFGEAMAKRPTREVTKASRARQTATESYQRAAEVAKAMGFTSRLVERFTDLSRDYHVNSGRLAAMLIEVGGMTRSLRIAIQSLLLGVAAWLVINDQATPGVMIASSIIAARALAPIEMLMGRWRSIIQARDSWGRIREALEAQRPSPAVLDLPAPRNSLVVDSLTVAPDGVDSPTAEGATFRLTAGDALGVVGPSGSGKSSLVRGIAGVWRPVSGEVRIDGALLQQYPEPQIASIMGYLPQDVKLVGGSVAENIARFDPEATPPEIISAARLAGAHEMILGLPQGYSTQVGHDGMALSGGQRQRIGLARALFRSPFLLILDEPNSNLDSIGEQALLKAIGDARKRGAIVILVAHRLNMLQEVNKVLLMVDGKMRAFGDRDEVMAKINKPQGPQADDRTIGTATARPAIGKAARDTPEDRRTVDVDPA